MPVAVLASSNVHTYVIPDWFLRSYEQYKDLTDLLLTSIIQSRKYNLHMG